MNGSVLIVGQGLAGTLLAWTCEREGVPFVVTDAGHERASSRVGAGMITPVTGRRWVKSWRVDAWLAPALATYREIETMIGVPLVRRLRVRRLFRDAGERRALEERVAKGELAPYIAAVDDRGAWIEGAAQVDTAALISALRIRWLESGHLIERRVDPCVASADFSRTVVCGGAEAVDAFAFVPWERAWGEIIEGDLPGLDPGVVLNRGHWLLPEAGDRVRVGATYERADVLDDRGPSAAARDALARSAAELAGRPLGVLGQEGGWRVTAPDRRPCAGLHPETTRLGLLGGLGSKGTLWAPALAGQWIDFLREAMAFPAEVDVARFWKCGRGGVPRTRPGSSRG